MTKAAQVSFSSLPKDPAVSEVIKYILRHPLEMIVRRWNWKAAALSGIMRGLIYFFTHISLGWRAALSAMSLEFLFRVFNSGATSSVSQAFRTAQPHWLANTIVMIGFPAYAHTFEYILHTINGDRNVNKSIVVSIIFSALSAIFNLHVMRRGTLLVKDTEQKSFWSDLKQMPVIFFEFFGYPFIWVYRKLK
jgi:hypothetical protein